MTQATPPVPQQFPLQLITFLAQAETKLDGGSAETLQQVMRELSSPTMNSALQNFSEETNPQAFAPFINSLSNEIPELATALQLALDHLQRGEYDAALADLQTPLERSPRNNWRRH